MPRIIAISAETSAKLLINRFLDPGTTTDSTSVDQVLLHSTGGSDSSSTSSSSSHSDLAPLVINLCDTTGALKGPEFTPLYPQHYIPFLTRRICALIDQHNGLAAIVERGVQRGHAVLIANQLIASAITTATPAIITRILSLMPPGPAVERLLEAIVRESASTAHEANKDIDLVALLPNSKSILWDGRPEVRYFLQDKVLTQKVLPWQSMTSVLKYLCSIDRSTDPNGGTVLQDAALRVATLWSDVRAIRNLPVPRQAYLTACLVQSLHLLATGCCGCRDGLGDVMIVGQGNNKQSSSIPPALLSVLLRGISNRLESPREVIRVQGMRVGNVLSQYTGGSGSDSGSGDNNNNNGTPGLLFDDEDLSLRREEVWEMKRHAKQAKIQETPALLSVSSPPPPPSPSSVSSSDSEFERFGVDDDSDLEDENVKAVQQSTLQLRDLIANLQKSESDWKAHLLALRSAETLIQAHPDELAHYAPQLARVLLLTKVPRWAGEEQPRGEDGVEVQRFRALVATTVAEPEPVGLMLADQVYSPSLDVQQRVRALGVMAASAAEITSPGTALKAIDSSGSGSSGSSKKSSTKTLGKKVGTVTKRKQPPSSSTTTIKTKTHQQVENRFPPIALKWANALLRQVDVRRQGVDLFNRDSYVLGRVLATLGSLLEASQHSNEAVPMGLAVLQLLRAPAVHASEEPFVRRAALMASANVLMAVPPVALSSISGSKDPTTMALSEGIEWVKGWVAKTAEEDGDEGCRGMGEACRGLALALTTEAMQRALQNEQEKMEEFRLPGSELGALTLDDIVLPSSLRNGGTSTSSSIVISAPSTSTTIATKKNRDASLLF